MPNPSRLPKKRLASLALGYLLLVSLTCDAAGESGSIGKKRPNLVVFLVDDLGWGAMGAFGSTLHETPHFDKLCSAGMRFTHSYSACTVCSPSRAALLTGRYPARLRLTDFIPGKDRPKSELRIPKWERQIDPGVNTLPESLRSHGYQTWFLGKWHLMPLYRGWSEERIRTAGLLHTPQAHGFDVNVGGREWGQPKGRGKYFGPFDMPGLEESKGREYLTDRLTDEAVELIDGAGGQPFFLYLSYYTVHTPLMAKPEDTAHFRAKLKDPKGPEAVQRAKYAAMHKSLDDSVGRVVAKLEADGLLDSTVIVFTGDNGGDRHDACGGLRGRKGTAFEGGVRVPTCVVWPGVALPGSVCDTPIVGTDLYPTLLDVAGLPPEPEAHIDGVSLAPLLRQSGAVGRETLYWHYPHYHRTKPYSAVRHGDWKLIEFHEGDPSLLFNLASDPTEQHNLFDQEPKQATELHQRLATWKSETGAQMPTPRVRAEPSAKIDSAIRRPRAG